MAVEPITLAPAKVQGCRVCGKQLSRKNVSGHCRAHGHLWRADPEKNAAAKAKYSATVRADYATLRARLSRASHARLSWCPIEYRQEYHRLKRVKNLPAPIARRLIEQLIEAHVERYRRTGELQQVTG